MNGIPFIPTAQYGDWLSLNYRESFWEQHFPFHATASYLSIQYQKPTMVSKPLLLPSTPAGSALEFLRRISCLGQVSEVEWKDRRKQHGVKSAALGWISWSTGSSPQSVVCTYWCRWIEPKIPLRAFKIAFDLWNGYFCWVWLILLWIILLCDPYRSVATCSKSCFN